MKYSALTRIDRSNVAQLEVAWSWQSGEEPVHAPSDLPALGQLGNAGPMVTAGGLVFLSGNNPWMYAIDAASGEILWEGDLGGLQGTANPMTYRGDDGRQYVVTGVSTAAGAAGGLIAFALPAG